MNNDISNLQQQKNGGLFHTRNYLASNQESYANRKTLWGYIGPTSDKDIARGQYLVFVNELNGAPILARLLFSPYDLGPNGTGGGSKKLELHQPVLLLPLNETGEYGIISTYIPLTNEIENEISSYIVASAGEPLVVGSKNNESKYKPTYTIRQNFEAGFGVNEVKSSGLTIKPFNFNEVNYSWSQLGNLYIDSYNGDRYEQILNEKTVSSSSLFQLVDGTNKTKVDKSKSELFKFYQHSKYKLANSTKRLYEYRNGKIIPGLLLSQIRTFSGNFGEVGEDLITIIDGITKFFDQADTIISNISDFIEWFDSGILNQVTDLISIIGLPTGLSISNVVNLGLTFNGDNPLGVSIDLNLGNKFIESFLEGVANSLISDFIGDTSLNSLIEGGLKLLGIDIKGRDKPDETQTVNDLNPKIPSSGNNKSLVEVIEGLGDIIPGSFGNYLKSLNNITESIGLTVNGTIQLNNPYGDYFSYLDYTKLNLNLELPEARLSSYLSTLGYEYAPFVIQSIKNFELTQNPIYTLMALLPLVPLSDKIWISLFIFYVTKSENSFLFLLKEFIEPDISPLSHNSYLSLLVNLKHSDILTFIENYKFNNFNGLKFNDLILSPQDSLYSLNLHEQLKYYFLELLDGKILNFLRGSLLLTSGYDIMLDLDLYKKFNLLVKEIYYA